MPEYLFNKVAGLNPATSLKKRLRHRCFPANFAKFLRKPFFIEHLRWLLAIFRYKERTFPRSVLSSDLRNLIRAKQTLRYFTWKTFYRSSHSEAEELTIKRREISNRSEFQTSLMSLRVGSQSHGNALLVY